MSVSEKTIQVMKSTRSSALACLSSAISAESFSACSTDFAAAAVLLALAALAVLSQPERNPYEVHEVLAVEEGAAMET